VETKKKSCILLCVLASQISIIITGGNGNCRKSILSNEYYKNKT
jgi:hypothetical protein